VIVRPRADADLPGCVEALATVHEADKYPKVWPADPAGWLAPGKLDLAWIAVDEGSVLGHIGGGSGVDDPALLAHTGRPADELVQVARLFVVPAARGRRIAQSLLGALTDHAAATGRRPVLDVLEESTPAIRLYEGLGWQLVGRRRADWTTMDGRHPMIRVYAGPSGTGH
jgi:GNAT superfamily N-acetyltransferase